MTVKELITILQEFPEGANVFISEESDGGDAVYSAKLEDWAQGYVCVSIGK